jgi:hypothetical protein
MVNGLCCCFQTGVVKAAVLTVPAVSTFAAVLTVTDGACSTRGFFGKGEKDPMPAATAFFFPLWDTVAIWA